MVNANEVAAVLSIRPCTLTELCELFHCSPEKIRTALSKIPNLNFQADYYYVGDLTEVIQKFIFYSSPFFLSYVQTKTSQLIKKLTQLPQNWAWLPKEQREPLLEYAFSPFHKIIPKLLNEKP